jgi:hypothetical protein
LASCDRLSVAFTHQSIAASWGNKDLGLTGYVRKITRGGFNDADSQHLHATLCDWGSKNVSVETYGGGMDETMKVRPIQLLVSDLFNDVNLALAPDGALDIHVGLHHSWEDVHEGIADLLTENELEIVRQLWSDDECEREFRRTAEGLRISLKS